MEKVKEYTSYKIGNKPLLRWRGKGKARRSHRFFWSSSPILPKVNLRSTLLFTSWHF